jgi:hypothetical protein
LGFTNRRKPIIKSTNPTKTLILKMPQAHVHGVRCLQVSGDTLISGGSDKLIFVWSVKQVRINDIRIPFSIQ